jgi:hypothetical protein
LQRKHSFSPANFDFLCPGVLRQFTPEAKDYFSFLHPDLKIIIFGANQASQYGMFIKGVQSSTPAASVQLSAR